MDSLAIWAGHNDNDCRSRIPMPFLIRLLLRVLFRVRVFGDLAPFGHADRLLIVANHHSRLDAVMLALFLPRNPVVVVPPDETGSWFTRWLLSHVRHEGLDLNNPLSMKRGAAPAARRTSGGAFPRGAHGR